MPNPSAAARLALAVLPLFLAGCSSLAGSGSADTGEAPTMAAATQACVLPAASATTPTQ